MFDWRLHLIPQKDYEIHVFEITSGVVFSKGFFVKNCLKVGTKPKDIVRSYM